MAWFSFNAVVRILFNSRKIADAQDTDGDVNSPKSRRLLGCIH